MAAGGPDPRAQVPPGDLVIGRHRIEVVKGAPDHVELAALTAALFLLARADGPGPGPERSTRRHRAHWDRNLPHPVRCPSHSWRARPGSPFHR